MSLHLRVVSEISPTRYYTKRGYVTDGGSRKEVTPYSIAECVSSEFAISSAEGALILLLPNDNSSALALNKAYEKLLDNVRNGASASLGATIASYKEAYGMIADRSIQLFQAYKAVRRGNLVRAANILGIPKKAARQASRRVGGRQIPGKVSVKHYASALWLELHFGWQPLIGDIHDALKTVESLPPKAGYIYGFGNQPYRKTNSAPWDYLKYDFTGTVSVKYAVRVEVTNPNLHLASKMGLINPFSIAWELVPFSFVVDWFTNVGQILDSVTDFVGLDLISGYTNTHVKSSGLMRSVYGSQNMRLFSFSREKLTSFPTPKLAYRSPLGGPARAATQIALLVQLFLKP